MTATATNSSAIRSPIAIDGPAASGKGTIAKRLAEHLGYAYLDTGSLYRAVGVAVAALDKDPNDTQAALEVAETLNISQLNNAAWQASIRTPNAGMLASIVAAKPEVRAAILEIQRNFASNPDQKGCILDGRDIGTIICPDAPHKLFITASPEIRAERRWKELQKQQPDILFDGVLKDIEARDKLDRERSIAPLKQAETAHLLDTSYLSIEEAFSAALALLDK
jgi:CMP/dCMP kinase